METRNDEPQGGRREPKPGSNVVRLEDWLCPPEELVPFGVSTRPANEPRTRGTGSQERPTPPTTLVRPEDFWGEGSAAIHDALEAPAAPAATPQSGRKSPQDPLRRRIIIQARRQPERLWETARAGTRLPAMRLTVVLLTLAVAGLGAGIVTTVLGQSQRSASGLAHSLEARDAAGSLNPFKPRLVAAVAGPFAEAQSVLRRRSARTLAVRHRAITQPPKNRPGAAPAAAMTRPSTTAGTAVAAEQTSAGRSVSQAPQPVVASASPSVTPAVSSAQSPARPATSTPSRSSAGSTSNRPAFGANGLLGPGSSPDS